MDTHTEQIFGTLELLVESVKSIRFPGHEDGGRIYPFIWETSQEGEFNALNLSLSKGWLKLTDKDVALKSWQDMKYLKEFGENCLSQDEWNKRFNQVTTLFEIINQNLQDLVFFKLKTYYDADDIIVAVGKTIDEKWIALSHTVYVESSIPKEQINRTKINISSSNLSLGNNTFISLSQIDEMISELGTITLANEGGGYYYNYYHSMVYSIAQTKEQAIENILQESGMLEISNFHAFYPESQDFFEYEGYEDDYRCSTPERFHKINQFFANNFPNTMMYRFSFWTTENIYIIGETQSDDRTGIYIKSNFVYNP
jgi:hypothetical protein